MTACSTITCHANAACLDITGTVACHCKNGYEGDGTTCTEVNPCTKPNSAALCDGNATCQHTGPGTLLGRLINSVYW